MNVKVPATEQFGTYVGRITSEPNTQNRVRVDYNDWTGRHCWGFWNLEDLEPADG